MIHRSGLHNSEKVWELIVGSHSGMGEPARLQAKPSGGRKAGPLQQVENEDEHFLQLFPGRGHSRIHSTRRFCALFPLLRVRVVEAWFRLSWSHFVEVDHFKQHPDLYWQFRHWVAVSGKLDRFSQSKGCLIDKKLTKFRGGECG